MADRGLGADHRKLRLIVLARSAGRCECPGCGRCSGSCSRPATTADHVRARADGGQNVLGNYRSACLPCNSSLGARLGNERRRVHPFFRAMAPQTLPPLSSLPQYPLPPIENENRSQELEPDVRELLDEMVPYWELD